MKHCGTENGVMISNILILFSYLNFKTAPRIVPLTAAVFDEYLQKITFVMGYFYKRVIKF